MSCSSISFSFFFFNDTATTEIYTLSLHDALPISQRQRNRFDDVELQVAKPTHRLEDRFERGDRSEEHTSELQSRLHLVCRLLLEKKKKNVSSRPNNTVTADTTTQQQPPEMRVVVH